LDTYDWLGLKRFWSKVWLLYLLGRKFLAGSMLVMQRFEFDPLCFETLLYN
jgi:hypothetical protein